MPIHTKIVRTTAQSEEGGHEPSSVPELKPCDELVLRREPGILPEINVIQVWSQSGSMLGYLDADLAADPAFNADADAAAPCRAFVTNVGSETGGSYKIMVIMPDDNLGDALQELENIWDQHLAHFHWGCGCFLIAAGVFLTIFFKILFNFKPRM